ncbi:hypothetical protein Taro_044724 [Colocasia esculenta]|uniref:Uncharacterized protein n=1 Tax=Colocasia esculenta TaxID=4460 RepID=A0A843WMM1_COLES|nr:hypothetical protein [Colocasia esculenta]
MSEIDQFPGPVDTSILYAQNSHRSQLVYAGQRTDSSTSHAGPSEPCADTPQQSDDAGPSHCSPDVMTVSQYEGMTDT